jgi:hypothetical protein
MCLTAAVYVRGGQKCFRSGISRFLKRNKWSIKSISGLAFTGFNTNAPDLVSRNKYKTSFVITGISHTCRHRQGIFAQGMNVGRSVT